MCGSRFIHHFVKSQENPTYILHQYWREKNPQTILCGVVDNGVRFSCKIPKFDRHDIQLSLREKVSYSQLFIIYEEREVEKFDSDS